MNPRATHPTIVVIMIGLALAIIGAPASAQLIKSRQQMPQLGGVGIDPQRGSEVPRDLRFTDAFGREVRMGDFFDGQRPVMLVLAYYDCPLLCTLVLNNVQDTLNKLRWTAGDQFRILTVSFDHTNTTAMARNSREIYLSGYDREDLPEDAWVFCTGDVENVRALSKAMGYHYRYIPETQEYSHPAALMFLTPDGRVHNYIENLKYRPRDIKLALLEASEGKQGSIFDRVEHFCFVYDPDTGGFVLAKGMMKTGGILTILALGAFIAWAIWSGTIRAEHPRDGATHANPTIP